jgi:ABC-type transport system involved in multi-copper enzyme maturation permease subunit
MLGPHFYWDLVRLARRRRTILLRVGYGLFLLTALFLVYSSQLARYSPLAILFDPGPVLPFNALARFAESFVGAVLVLQTMAVFVLTPAYVAGAIVEEREGKTLELLFTTHLSDREIVLGKMCGRLVHLGGVLLTGIPILGLTPFFGGVDMQTVLTGFAAAFLTLLGIGSLCMLVSVHHRTVVGAVTTAYFFSFLFALILLPVLASTIFSRAPTLLPFVVINGLLMVCLPVAISGLREWQHAGRPVVRHPLQTLLQRRSHSSRVKSVNTSSIAGRPLLWKELNYPRTDTDLAFAIIVSPCVALFFLTLFVEMPLTPANERFKLWTAVLRILVLSLAGFTCVGAALRATGSLVRERHQKTLDGLLTLPISRREILSAKWLGGMLRGRTLMKIGAGVLLVGVATLAVHPLGLLLFLAAFAAHLGFLASLGIWVSTMARTPVRANFAAGLLLLLFFFGSWWILQLSTQAPSAWSTELLELGLSPIGSWWFSLFSWDSWLQADADFGKKVGAVAAGIGIYLLLACLCWCDALRRFRARQ